MSNKQLPEIQLYEDPEGLETYAEKVQFLQQAIYKEWASSDGWIVSYVRLLGEKGLILNLLNASELERFKSSEVCDQLMRMMTEKLSHGENPRIYEKERMITLRIPESVANILELEAHEAHVSINRLLTAKAMHFLPTEHTPTTKGKIRGRKPGYSKEENPNDLDQSPNNCADSHSLGS